MRRKAAKGARRKGKYFHHFSSRTPCGWQTAQEACIMNFRFSSRRVQVSRSYLASETFSHVILVKKVSQNIKLRRLIYHLILKKRNSTIWRWELYSFLESHSKIRVKVQREIVSFVEEHFENRVNFTVKWTNKIYGRRGGGCWWNLFAKKRAKE